MNDGGGKDDEQLTAVHQCEKCGVMSRPSQTSDEVNVTGVVVCPKCGHSGPLSIRIVADGQS